MQKNKNGSGLIFAVILLFVILAMVVTLSSVTVLETKMSQKTKSSVGAFYNSESGVEWALNQISNATGQNISDAFPGYAGNMYACPANFNCNVYFLDQNGKVITSNLTLDQVKAVRSVGTQAAGDSTQRAIEAAVAANDERYQVNCFGSVAPGSFYSCCRIEIATGSTDCKVGNNSSGPWTSYASKPFDASAASGRWRLSCYYDGIISGVGYNNCCRYNVDTGDTECKVNNSSSGPWTSYASKPF